MTTDQERLKLLGFFGIIKESFVFIFTTKKFLARITPATIFPLCFIFFAHLQISEFLFVKIFRVQAEIDYYPTTNPRYSEISDISTGQWVGLGLFQIFCFFVFLLFYLLSTSTIAYATASAYTSQSPSNFKKSMGIIPMVWRRLFVTFFWCFFIALAFILVTIGLFIGLGVLLSRIYIPGIVILCVLAIADFILLVYVVTILHFGTVACVLEQVQGLQALKKGKILMMEKRVVAVAIFLVLTLLYSGIQFVFQLFVVFYLGGGGSVGSRIGFAVLCFFLLSAFVLFGIVVQTIIYLVCKAKHGGLIGNSPVNGDPEAVVTLGGMFTSIPRIMLSWSNIMS